MRILRVIGFLTLTLAALSAVGGASQKPKTSSKHMKHARQIFDAGRRAEEHANWPQAYSLYSHAAAEWPENPTYKMRQSLARFHLVQGHVLMAEREAASGQLDSAREELKVALELDPTYEVALERLAEIDQMLAQQSEPAAQRWPQLPQVEPAPGDRSFDYRGDTEGAYQEIARQFGVSVVFDPEMPHRQIRFRVADVDFQTALRLVGEMTGTFWRALGPRMLFVTANSPAKVKEYAPSVVRTVTLAASQTPTDMEQTARIVRDIAELTRTQLNAATHTLVMRGTPEKVALATELVRQMEQPRGEILLEMDVLEVDRQFARQLGITPPSSAHVYTLSPSQIQQAQQSLDGLIAVITQVFGAPSSIAGLQTGQIQSLLGAGQLSASTLLPPLVVFGGGKTTFFSTLPGAVAQLAESLNLVHGGQQMLLRAEDGEQASFFVGDRFPVSLASLSGSLGSSGLVPQVSNSSFPASVFPVGKKPAAVATGDFNGDGFADLAVANQGDNTVSILLNNGSGSFTAGQVISTQLSPTSIVAGDFNGDGKLDLAVANRDSDSISILLGNGNGGFSPVRQIPVGLAPVSVIAADFNGDGKLDIAVANRDANTVSILLGSGDGGFQPQVEIPVGATPVALTSGDFNGDGKTDLAVVAQGSNQVLILLGNGDGTFTPGNTFATGKLPTSIVSADFNGDGKSDLAVTNENDNTVSLLVGKGDGTFQPQIAFKTGNQPAAMVAADFNLDGFPDLAVVGQSANAVSVLLNDGTGNLTFGLSLNVGNSPDAIASADFDKNGRADVAVVNQSDNSVTVILNDINLIPGSAANTTPYPAAQFIDLGLKVEVTPRLHPDGEVTLKMNVEIHGLTPQDVNGIPILTNRTIEQTARLKEGQSTMVASMLNPQQTLTLTGWPGLAPLGGRNAQNQDTELLIVVRPRLVRLPEYKRRTIYAGVGAGQSPP